MLLFFRELRGVVRPLALVLAAVVHALAPQTVAAQATARRSVPAMRLAADERVVLDGRLDEPFWSRAVPAGDFMQVDPDNGKPATERTEVRITYDADALYMGVTCFDSEPGRGIAYQRRRDEFLQSDDKFRWTIDTFLDARSGYFFEMNSIGAMADALMSVNGQNRQWDGIWEGRAHRSGIGWFLEIRIPFRTLNFNPANDSWGINFDRTVARKNETIIWTGWPRNQGLQRMTNAGLVTGISDVSQGHGLDIKPYGVFTAESSPGRGQRGLEGHASAGIDLFYSLTPLLRTNLTVNTDFAQTEVDQRQVNLTRFSLFFPEKRDFFLDGATFFDFGSPTNADLRINPFFSRRIGLSSGGTPQKVDFGTKITGQMGRQDVGVLHVRTGDDHDMIGEDFTVARVKRRMLRQSYVGAMYTRRDERSARPGLTDPRHTGALDFRLATSRFRGSQNLETSGWMLYASRPDGSSGNASFGGTVNYPNDRWSARVDASEVQAHFDPGVGFVTRRNYRRYTPSLVFSPRPADHPYIRRLTFGGSADVQTDLHNALLTRAFEINAIEVNFHSQETVAFQINPTRERLDEPFTLTRGITLPVGAEYDFTRYQLRAQTGNRRKLAFNGRYEGGGFYSGTRSEKVVGLTVRARPGLIVYLTGEWNDITLAEGTFKTKLYRVVGETQFSPFIALVNNVQYDTQSAVVGWQSRFRWILTPGNDLYVVYTHNWLDQPSLDRFATLDKRLASKILYTYRF